MSGAPTQHRTTIQNRDGVRSALLLCWRDTGHPQGGGSEAYLQRIGAQLVDSGVAVSLRTARYPGAPRRSVVDGIQISRGGGPYTVYILAGLAMVLSRFGLGPLRHAKPDVVIDTQNGLPFLARLAFGRRVVVLDAISAKGLEFDSVILVEPAQIIGHSTHGLGDLYVGLTRAKQRLYVPLLPEKFSRSTL